MAGGRQARDRVIDAWLRFCVERVDRCDADALPAGGVRWRVDSRARSARCEVDATIVLPEAVGAGIADGAAWARLIGAHEAVHAVQMLCGWRLADAKDCEAEAAWASVNVLHGRRVRVTCRPVSGAALHWGPVGHYYTVFYLALVAGFAEETAASLAFFSWMPDGVSEMDATEAAKRMGMWNAAPSAMAISPGTGLAWVATVSLSYSKGAIPQRVTVPTLDVGAFSSGLFDYASAKVGSVVVEAIYEVTQGTPIQGELGRELMSGYALQREARERMDHSTGRLSIDTFSTLMPFDCVDYFVQRGLHALTGQNAEVERSQRVSLIRRLKGDPVRLGWAIHSYGDTFAHIDEHSAAGSLYRPGIGHGFDGHEPDQVDDSKKTRFIGYASGLLGILRELAGTGGAAAGRGDGGKVGTLFANIAAASRLIEGGFSPGELVLASFSSDIDTYIDKIGGVAIVELAQREYRVDIRRWVPKRLYDTVWLHDFAPYDAGGRGHAIVDALRQVTVEQIDDTARAWSFLVDG